MNYPMLAVDTDIEVSRREQAEWLKHGITTMRVDTMQEAIKILTEQAFLFTAINADTVNYLPLLKVMRETAPTLIFIIATDYTKEKEVEALYHGADVFTAFNANTKLNVQLALAQLLRCNERNAQPQKPPGLMICVDFLITANERRIFLKDKQLILTKTEYDILYYLISNHDFPLTYNRIYNKIWGRDYDKAEHKILWDYINKIRKKLKSVTGDTAYIVTERDMGYRFTTTPGKKNKKEG